MFIWVAVVLGRLWLVEIISLPKWVSGFTMVKAFGGHVEAILELPRGFVLGGTLQFLGPFKREQEGKPPFRHPTGSGPSGAEDFFEVAAPLGEPHLHGSQILKIAGSRESHPRLFGGSCVASGLSGRYPLSDSGFT